MADYDRSSATKIAGEISVRDQCDIYIYNGPIDRVSDLIFIRNVHKNKRFDKCRLVLTTNGGDPDAAYKMSRYAQEKYNKFELLLGGMCKSAGTLIAIGAHELILSPYGELGPLDIQVPKEDKLLSHSGLNISEALQALERRAFTTYLKLIGDIFKSSGGVVSFQTASKSASDVLSALYAPIFAQFDPEDIGGRTRSMRIASEYGKRLDALSRNMKPDAVRKLAETYQSHGFVIDRAEAKHLFKNVRDADKLEVELLEALDGCSRWQLRNSGQEPIIECLSSDQRPSANQSKDVRHAVSTQPPSRRRARKTVGGDTKGTSGASSAQPGRTNGK